MKSDFDAALDDCLDLLRAGSDIETCLARYPQHAPELRSLLTLAADMRTMTTPAPSPAARQAGRRRMLDTFANKRARRSTSIWDWFTSPIHTPSKAKPRHLDFIWQLAAASFVVLLIVFGGAIMTSASSVPGDALYPIKRAVQDARIALTFDANARSQLREQISAEQRRDVQIAIDAKRHIPIEFQGVLRQMDQDAWVVDKLLVTLRAETVVIGQPRLGAWVAVHGYLPGDGSVIATRLVVSAESTPVPTVTPEPTAMPTLTLAPEPTEASPTLTYTPTPTPKPRPTQTPELTHTPEPTQMPEMSETPQPAETAEPTETPKPAHTPQPTETPQPTQTPELTETPEPTHTPEPTETPRPTHTPEPTETPEHTQTPWLTPTPQLTETPVLTATPHDADD